MATERVYDGPRLETAIIWFRRDLRLYDNPAVVAAVQSGARNVIPAFIWTPEEEGQFQPGRQTRWWSKQTVLKFAQHLERMGSRLIIRRSQDSCAALQELIRETGAQGVFFNHLYDSISMMRDNDIKDQLRRQGLVAQSFNSDVLYEPWEVLDIDGTPFTTFKRFWDRVLGMPYPPPLPLPEPLGLPPLDGRVSSLELDQLDWFMTPEQEASTDALQHRWQPGTDGAHARLEHFLGQILPQFEHDRAKTDRESTTMLSPWIHFGSISVRYIYYRVAQVHSSYMGGGADISKSCLDFLQQMGYREYSRYLSFHFPFITERSMLAHLRACPFRRDAQAFKAWRQGQTGYPLIDAGMRQLWATGWCHNRVRVVASSFLVKNLLLPWQWGLKHLWDCQIDADLECDALGWQYVAGCLADAHPFSYMIDLDKEWKRFDSNAEYVRRWLPVLARLPPEWAHQPWKAPKHVLDEAGVELGFNYPMPIVSTELAKRHVERASTIIEQCTSSSQGNSSGNSTGSVLPRKEPYRPASDPAVLAQILGAAAEGFEAWELTQKLPGLDLMEPARRPASRSGSIGSSGDRRYISGTSGSPTKPATPRGAVGDATAFTGAMETSDVDMSTDEASDGEDSGGSGRSGYGGRSGSEGGEVDSDSSDSGSVSYGNNGQGARRRSRRGTGGAKRAHQPVSGSGSVVTGASQMRAWRPDEPLPAMGDDHAMLEDQQVVPQLEDAQAEKARRRVMEETGSVS